MPDFTAERCCRELVELGPQAYRRAHGEAVYGVRLSSGGDIDEYARQQFVAQ